MDLEFKVQLEEEAGFISLYGDFDDEEAGEALRKSFNRVFDSGRRTVVLDLNKLDILNSYGVGKILTCHKRLKAEGGVLMVKPLSGVAKEILELLMIDTIIPVYREPGEDETLQEDQF
jgi:anti-anti-sigma factor